MGSSPQAHLGYGVDLGGDDEWKIAETGDYGELAVNWYDPDPECGSFEEQFWQVLYEKSPMKAPAGFSARYTRDHFGVDLEVSGDPESSHGYILVVKGSREYVEWSDAMRLDPARLAERPAEWDTRIDRVLNLLGLTPYQAEPSWLVWPSYR